MRRYGLPSTGLRTIFLLFTAMGLVLLLFTFGEFLHDPEGGLIYVFGWLALGGRLTLRFTLFLHAPSLPRHGVGRKGSGFQNEPVPAIAASLSRGWRRTYCHARRGPVETPSLIDGYLGDLCHASIPAWSSTLIPVALGT